MKDSERKFSNPTETEIPSEIEVAAVNGNLVFFIGNGLSRVYGLPSWGQLATKMIDLLADEKVISHVTADLLKTRSLKERMSIADRYFKSWGKKNSKLRYSTLFSKYTEPMAYQYLAKCGAKFVTTNYDTLLYQAYSAQISQGSPVPEGRVDQGMNTSGSQEEAREIVRIAQTPYDFTISDFLNNNIIWHLHGCIEKEDNIVSSTKDYLQLYSDPEIREMLDHIFSTQVVVFLGYGLDELEILDTIVRSSQGKETRKEKHKIFYVLPIYSYEFEIYRDLKMYYKDQLDIDVIPMCQDDFGYRAFEELVRAWSGKLVGNVPDRQQKLKLMQKLIDQVELSKNEQV